MLFAIIGTALSAMIIGGSIYLLGKVLIHYSGHFVLLLGFSSCSG